MGKSHRPKYKIVFLGIEIDSVNMCLRLPDAKLNQIRAELSLFKANKSFEKNNCNPLQGN